MGITLVDQKSEDLVFDVNFWHWRAIVEAVRRLAVLPAERAAALHEPFVGDLTQDEARTVATAIRERLLPTLESDDRLLLDGTRTKAPDDGTFYRSPEEQHRNYGTTREVLEPFTRYCETCAGFQVS